MSWLAYLVEVSLDVFLEHGESDMLHSTLDVNSLNVKFKHSLSPFLFLMHSSFLMSLSSNLLASFEMSKSHLEAFSLNGDRVLHWKSQYKLIVFPSQII